jgi:hypothetical protein
MAKVGSFFMRCGWSDTYNRSSAECHLSRRFFRRSNPISHSAFHSRNKPHSLFLAYPMFARSVRRCRSQRSSFVRPLVNLRIDAFGFSAEKEVAPDWYRSSASIRHCLLLLLYGECHRVCPPMFRSFQRLDCDLQVRLVDLQYRNVQRPLPEVRPNR